MWPLLQEYACGPRYRSVPVLVAIVLVLSFHLIVFSGVACPLLPPCRQRSSGRTTDQGLEYRLTANREESNRIHEARSPSHNRNIYDLISKAPAPTCCSVVAQTLASAVVQELIQDVIQDAIPPSAIVSVQRLPLLCLSSCDKLGTAAHSPRTGCSPHTSTLPVVWGKGYRKQDVTPGFFRMVYDRSVKTDHPDVLCTRGTPFQM